MAREPSATPAQILVVDDEPGILRTAQRILSRHYTVTTAASGQEALDTLARVPHNLAIVDVRMPGLNGFEILKHIKIHHPDTEVIIMTGSISNPEEKLVESLRERAFYFISKPFEKAVLEMLVDRCLERQRLERLNREHLEALRQDLERARVFQQLLLPRSFPRLQGLRGDVHYEPSDRIGGDFYDFWALEDGNLALVIADVAGHGVQAALYTGMLKSEMRAVRDDWDNLGRLFRRINNRLALVTGSQYITATVAVFDVTANEIRYVNAGHPRFFTRDGTAWESTGTPLGMISGWDYEVTSLPLQPGERVLFYTDGVSEASRHDHEELGEERLRKAFLATHTLPVDLAVDHVIAAAKEFAGADRLEDDATAIVIEYEPLPS